MAFNGFKIFDIHTHFPTLRGDEYAALQDAEYVRVFGEEKLQYLKKLSWEAQAKRWAAHKMAPPATDQKDDAEVMRLWEEDRVAKDIEKIVFVTGGGNENLARVIKDYPAFLGFAHHNPEEKDAVEKLEVAVKELGLVGYKIFAPTLKRPINDPYFYPLWEKVEELGIPVLIHFGILGGGAGTAGKQNCNPLMLEDVAKGFPFVNFIIPHFGAGYMRELLLLGWACKNIYVDLSGSNQWVNWMPYPITKRDVLARFIDTFGIDYLVYGSDSSFLPRGYIMSYLEEWMEICAQLRLSQAETAALFYGNAEKLLLKK